MIRFLLAGVLAGNAHGVEAVRFISSYNQVEYVTEVPERTIEKLNEWRPEITPAALAPDAAFRLADGEKTKQALLPQAIYSSLSILHVGGNRWVYVIEYTLRDPGNPRLIITRIRYCVSLDGVVFSPVAQDRKR
jgi:hypothetical protein